jgi:hypothetical protein
MSEKKIAKQYGKIVKLPKESDVVSFMDNIKIPRNKLWYVLVEKQDNELHMVKYNQEGVNAVQFVQQLKEYYIKNFSDEKTLKLFEGIRVIGNDKFSVIKDIPDIELTLEKDNKKIQKKLLTRITEDLIKLLK